MARPLLVPLREIAAELGMPEKTLRVHVQTGQAPCHRVGPAGKIFFTSADVAAFLEAMRVPASTERAA
jgi:hypothetical protein